MNSIDLARIMRLFIMMSDKDHLTNPREVIKIVGLPMPPTVNRAFLFAHKRFIKSNEARRFDLEISKYALKYQKELAQSKVKVKRLIDRGMLLRVDVTFYFKYERLFSKTQKAKSRVKALDLNNRLKLLFDAVTRLIEVDDKFFFEHFVAKRTCRASEQEYCIVTVFPSSESETKDML